MRNRCSSRSLIGQLEEEGQALRTMRPTVTYGVVRDGMTSLTGNIRVSITCGRAEPRLTAQLRRPYNEAVALSRQRVRRAPRTLLLRVLLGLYIAAAALLPFAHHDIACHFKSTTHCTSCVIGAAGDLASDGVRPRPHRARTARAVRRSARRADRFALAARRFRPRAASRLTHRPNSSKRRSTTESVAGRVCWFQREGPVSVTSLVLAAHVYRRRDRGVRAGCPIRPGPDAGRSGRRRNAGAGGRRAGCGRAADPQRTGPACARSSSPCATPTAPG